MDEEGHSRRSSERGSSEATLLFLEQLNDEDSKTSHRQPFWRRYILPLCIHFVVFLTYSTLVLLGLNSRPRDAQCRQNILYSPANEVLRWSVQKFDLGDGTTGPYSGYPRPELEEEWTKLLGNMNIRLSLEDLKAFDRDEDAVELPDGSGYVGTLNIYHEIHCVKWLHTHMYQEHYFPNLSDAYFSKLMRMKGFSKDKYAAVRTSEDDSASSKDGLLEKGDTDCQQEQDASIWRRYRTFILFQLVLLGVWTLVLCFMSTKIRELSVHGPDLIHSIAHEAVFWEERKFPWGDRIQEKSIYAGKPSPELDKAWHDLLNAENIRIEAEVMKRLGRENIGVRIPGDDGFIGTLNVYHEIHCLKRLHQYMYQDTYFPDIDDTQRELNRLHNEHCIDFLRQSAMCHGDVGLITFEWSPTNLIPVANGTTHQCVNWEKLDQWTKERTVDMMKPGWLVHPTLGPAYPKGEGDKIGAATGGHQGD